MSNARPRFNRVSLTLLIASSVVWMLCGAAFLLVQASDAIGVCDALGGSNNVGASRWQIWPPGRECVYEPDELPPIDLNTGKGVALVIPVSSYSALAVIMLCVFPVGVVSALKLQPTVDTDA